MEIRKPSNADHSTKGSYHEIKKNVIFTSILIFSQSTFSIDVKGSLADGKHTYYVPPISNPRGHDQYHRRQEVNTFTTVNSSNYLPFDFEGVDLVNFASSDREDLVDKRY